MDRCLRLSSLGERRLVSFTVSSDHSARNHSIGRLYCSSDAHIFTHAYADGYAGAYCYQHAYTFAHPDPHGYP